MSLQFLDDNWTVCTLDGRSILHAYSTLRRADVVYIRVDGTCGQDQRVGLGNIVLIRVAFEFFLAKAIPAAVKDVKNSYKRDLCRQARGFFLRRQSDMSTLTISKLYTYHHGG